MFELESLCREYEKLSYDERRKILSELAQDIMPALKLISNGMEDFELLIMASCSADRKLSVDEYSLIKDSTGLDFSYDRVSSLVKSIDAGDVNNAADILVDAFANFSKELKSEMVSFCLCICSADNRVTLKEKSFIKKLLS